MTMLETMRSLEGLTEAPGAADNPDILKMATEIASRYPEMTAYCGGYRHDSISWCGLVMGYCAALNGLRPPFAPGNDLGSFLWVDAWGTFGSPVKTPQSGDILIFSTPHHVTLYVGENQSTYQGLGGNQSDMVKVSSFSKAGLRAVRRPPQAAIDGTTPVVNLKNSGRASWYSQNPPVWVDDSDIPESNALRVPDKAQGIALPDHSTLGQWFRVQAPNKWVSIEQHTDNGPAVSTGRLIDISAAAAPRFGYDTPGEFPTDSVWTWEPVEPPAEVAGLEPKKQAVKYLALRSKTPVAPPPVIIPPGPVAPGPTVPNGEPIRLLLNAVFGTTGDDLTMGNYSSYIAWSRQAADLVKSVDRSKLTWEALAHAAYVGLSALSGTAPPVKVEPSLPPPIAAKPPVKDLSMPSTPQLLAIARWALTAGGPAIAAFLMAHGASADQVSALNTIAAWAFGAGAPAISLVWSLVTHSIQGQIKAAAAVPGVSVQVDQRIAPQAAVQVAADPEQPKVQVR